MTKNEGGWGVFLHLTKGHSVLFSALIPDLNREKQLELIINVLFPLRTV